MKAFQVVIHPQSSFGTSFDGDTIFGHFAWELADDKSVTGKPLLDLLKDYEQSPFLITSSAFPMFGEEIVFPRPKMPLTKLIGQVDAKERKDIEKKGFFKFKSGAVDFSQLDRNHEKFKSLEDIFKMELVESTTLTRNSISRITGTTGAGGDFTPYAESESYLNSQVNYTFFVLSDILSKEVIHKISERIGLVGYGKNASTGKGRFEVIKTNECAFLDSSSQQKTNAYLTLAPSVDQNLVYYEAMVRYGKHGRTYANSEHPFKNPILFATAGSVGKGKLETNFVGKGLTGVSKHPGVVSQGFAPVLPILLPEGAL